jgi:hypothetical protein
LTVILSLENDDVEMTDYLISHRSAEIALNSFPIFLGFFQHFREMTDFRPLHRIESAEEFKDG